MPKKVPVAPRSRQYFFEIEQDIAEDRLQVDFK